MVPSIGAAVVLTQSPAKRWFAHARAAAEGHHALFEDVVVVAGRALERPVGRAQDLHRALKGSRAPTTRLSSDLFGAVGRHLQDRTEPTLAAVVVVHPG